MSSAPFVSYAGNAEDVVLSRALRDVEKGRYVELGARDPIEQSPSHAFYQRGWSGIVLTSTPAATQEARAQRPRDIVIEAEPGSDTPTGRLRAILADAGLAGADIQFLVVDAPVASRADVLAGIDLDAVRPWVLLVRDSRSGSVDYAPGPWVDRVLDAGYEGCLFDGVTRFFVAKERSAQLAGMLSVPPNRLDDYRTQRDALRDQELQELRGTAADLAAQRDRLTAERDRAVEQLRQHDDENVAAILEWRTSAVKAWATAASTGRSRDIELMNRQMDLHINHVKAVDKELTRLREELDAIRHTLSWRVTKPLRTVRTVTKRAHR